MEKNAVVKVKKQLNVTDLAGEKVMIDFASGKYFLIKGAGNDIWDMLQEEITPAQIVDRLLTIYEVSREECEASVMKFLEQMQGNGFIE